MPRRKRKRKPRPRARSQREKTPPGPPPATTPPSLAGLNQANPPGSNGNPDNKGKPEMQSKPKWTVTWSGSLAATIGIATVAQAFIAGFQWTTMRDQGETMVAQNSLIQKELAEAKAANQAAEKAANAAIQSNKIAEDTAHKQLRAYVTLSAATAENIDDGTGVEFTVRARNSGQTMATNVVINLQVFHTDFPYHGSFELTLDPERHVSKTVFGPGIELKLSKKYDANEKLRKALVDGRKAIWYFGQIRYMDIYGACHTTKFRCIIGGNAGAKIEEFCFASEGNEAN